MRLFAHLLLLVITCCLAWGAGLVPAASIALVAGLVCFGVRSVGRQWVRAVAFLGVVAAVVGVGWEIDSIGYGALIFAAPLAVQITALGWFLALKEEDAGGMAVPTLAFYGGLVAAYLAISGVPESWTAVTRALVATVLVASAIVTWRAGRGGLRFREASVEGRGSMRPKFGAVLGFVFLLVLLGTLLWKPLPWAGEKVVEAGAGVRAVALDLAERWGSGGTSSKSEEPVATADGEDGEGMDFGRRRELPQRAELEQSGEPLVHLQIPDAVAFGAYVSGRNYLRSWVLEQYTGDGWEEPEAEPIYREDLGDGEVDGWVRLRPGRGIKHRVYLPAAGGAGLPAIQNPLGFRLNFVFESAPDMFDAELRGAVFYDAESAPLRLEHLESDEIEPAVVPRPHLAARAGGSLGQRLALTTKTAIQGKVSPLQKLEGIRRFLLTNCSYGAKIENVDGLAPLENFLYGERVGWCDFFATAAVLMAREAGFPARMAYGFSGGQAFVKEQVVSYREKDAHAWAEVLVDGVGWVVFDTTPAGEGAARSPDPARRSAPAPNLDAYVPAEGSETDMARSPRGPLVPEWLRWAVLVAVGIGLIALVIRRILAGGDDDESASSRSRDERLEAGAPGYLREFIRLCREFGRARVRGETLRETVAGLEAEGLTGDALSGVAVYHYAVRYEGEPRDKRRESELSRGLKQLRKDLA